MNNHQKKIQRIVEAKNNEEADMDVFRREYFNAETMAQKRICEQAVRNCMKRLLKIYNELEWSVQENDKQLWGEDDLKAMYEQNEMETFIIRCNTVYI